MRSKFNLQAPEGVTESLIEGTYYWPETDPVLGVDTVQTTNVGHKDILVRHGYILLGEVSIMPPVGQMGLIEVEELGRAGLEEALKARGLSIPEAAGREELAQLATEWNQARRSRARADAAGADQIQVKAAEPGVDHTDEIAALKAEIARLQAAPAGLIVKPSPASLTAAQSGPAPGTVTSHTIVAPAAAPAPAVAAGEADQPSLNGGAVAKPDFTKYDYADLKGWILARGGQFKGNAARSILEKLADDIFEATLAKRQAAA